jgi:glycosyltransferase involved in cell wall biosynthesis
VGFSTRVVIPAFDAGEAVAAVVRSVRDLGWDDVVVIDDGSRDGTGDFAREAGARVVVHPVNRGKGSALRTGLSVCRDDGIDAMLTLDADGQHKATDLRVLMEATDDRDALVLGIRDLARAGAPRANQMSNGISDFFLSRFAGTRLRDTQCGLRRYPVTRTLALDPRGTGYEFEAEIILRAARAGVSIVQVPIDVHYPPEKDRKSHFRTRRDVPRIIFRVLETLVTARR